MYNNFNPNIIFHWGNYKVGTIIWNDYIIKWLTKYPHTNIFITTNLLDIDYFIDLIKPTTLFKNDDIIIINNYIRIFLVPNKGMDIGPFLHTIKYILNNYIKDDIIKMTFIKIHTKSIESWRNSMLNVLLNTNFNITNWLNYSMLIPQSYKYKLDDLNTSTITHILNLCNIFFKYNHTNQTGIISFNKIVVINNNEFDYQFYSKYNNIKLFYDNINDNIKFLDYHWNNIGKHKKLPYNRFMLELNDSTTYCSEEQCKFKNYYFSAGTMFWIKGDILYEFFSNINIDQHISLMEPKYTVNDKPTIVHAWERILSLIPYLYDKNILYQ